MSFDVGQRYDVPAQNYSIKVTAGDTRLLWATNPNLPTEPGSFQRVQLQFSTDKMPDEYLAIEIETQGTGHLHFDNFDIEYKQKDEKHTEYYHTVAHYALTTNKQTGEQACITLSSLNDANGNPYMNELCECINSKVAWVGKETTIDNVLEKRFFLCVSQSQQLINLTITGAKDNKEF